MFFFYCFAFRILLSSHLILCYKIFGFSLKKCQDFTSNFSVLRFSIFREFTLYSFMILLRIIWGFNLEIWTFKFYFERIQLWGYSHFIFLNSFGKPVLWTCFIIQNYALKSSMFWITFSMKLILDLILNLNSNSSRISLPNVSGHCLEILQNSA